MSVTTTDATARLAAVTDRVVAACQRVDRDPGSIRVLAASKYADAGGVLALARAGQRLFGENRVQDAVSKFGELPVDLREGLEVHMIGHLQSNKAQLAARNFDMVQTVDSLHLAAALSRAALRPIPVLVQVNVSRDPAKSGFLPEDLLAAASDLAAVDGLEVRGLMTIGALVGSPEAARPAFRALRQLRDQLSDQWPPAALQHLSMGMSGDFEVAIEEAATIVRVGTDLFGGHH